ncbi:MAG: hypothetical protein R2712_14285 [Vicinamibacterales bacterium]
METWTAIVAVLAGLVPALLIGVSVIGITLLGWLALTFPLASGSPAAAAVTVAVVTTLVTVLFERMWKNLLHQTSNQPSKAVAARPGASAPLASLERPVPYWLFGALSVLAAGWLQYRLPGVYASSRPGEWPLYERAVSGAWTQATAESGVLRWWSVTGIDNPMRAWV